MYLLPNTVVADLGDDVGGDVGDVARFTSRVSLAFGVPFVDHPDSGDAADLLTATCKSSSLNAVSMSLMKPSASGV